MADAVQMHSVAPPLPGRESVSTAGDRAKVVGRGGSALTDCIETARGKISDAAERIICIAPWGFAVASAMTRAVYRH
jgi:hypothetical protein